MKQSNIFTLLLAAVLAFSCTDYNPESETPTITEPARVSIDCDLVTEETSWQQTRSVSALESEASRLAISIFDSQDKLVQSYSQMRSGDNQSDTFGSIPDLRLSPGTYKVVVVAHKAVGAGEDPATIISPTEATIPTQSLRDVYSTVREITVQPNVFTAQHFDIEVPVALTQCAFKILDEIPSDVMSLRLTFNSGASVQGGFTFNPATGAISSEGSYSTEVDVKNREANKVYGLYAFMTEYPHAVNATIEALDAEKKVLFTRTIENQTFEKAQILIISCHLFTGITSSTFTFGGWTTDKTTVD